MKELSDFFKLNMIDFDKSMKPDGKLTALREGLKSYYETYSITSNGFYDYIYKAHSKVVLGDIRGHDFLIRYFSSVAFIHLSFEHFLTEILENTTPILSRLSVKKEIDFINILSGNIHSIETANKKNIDFSEALSRIERLIENHNSLPKEFQIDTKYHFLKNYIKTLKILATLRNDIIHVGKTMLNRYVYECFFVNQILPLVREYLKTQNTAPYVERNLYCNKNVIDEICKFPLCEKYENLSNYEEIIKNLRRINHFKELGRASYNNPIHMLEGIQTEEQKNNIEESYNRKKRSEADLIVEFLQDRLGHHKVHTCPCCGTTSLTTFEYWKNLDDSRTRVQTAECSVCTYKVNLIIGEPKDFDIMDTELFSYID